MPTITAQLFTSEVADERHPIAIRLRHAVDDLAEDYDTAITRFEVQQGIVTLDIPSADMCARILALFQEGGIQVIEIMADRLEFARRAPDMRRKK